MSSGIWSADFMLCKVEQPPIKRLIIKSILMLRYPIVFIAKF
jgi:hypothetical protein